MTQRHLDRLPTELRDALIGVGRSARGLFGTGDTQRIFDQHSDLFDQLYEAGASHRIVSELLKEIGVQRADGSALPVGTVSSARSRSRLRAAAAAIVRPGAATAGVAVQASADRCVTRQRPADPGRTLPHPPGNSAAAEGSAAAAADTVNAGNVDAFRPGPPPRTTGPQNPKSPNSAFAENTRVPSHTAACDAARILNHLRNTSTNDGETT